LAKSSLDVADVENTSQEDLTGSEKMTLDEWASSYDMKYPVIGTLKQ